MLGGRRTQVLFAGAIALSAVLVAAFTFASRQDPFSEPVEAARPNILALSPERLHQLLKDSFGMTDKNADGYIDATEAPEGRSTQTNPDGTQIVRTGPDIWVEGMDEDQDRRVNWDEFHKSNLDAVEKLRAQQKGKEFCPECR